jgi:ATP/maltotriose-dependent transcriptional regulator MalT
MATSTLVNTLVALGEYDMADPLITDAVADARSSFGRDNASTYQPVASLASLRFAQGRLTEAEELARNAVEISTRARGPLDLHTAFARTALAVIFVDQRKSSDAERELRTVLDIASRYATDGEHPYEISAKHFLAEALLQQGDNSGAEFLLQEELAALGKMGAADWRIARAHSVLSEVYLKTGRLQDAERHLAMAKSKLTRMKGWPVEREVRNLARRLQEFDALRPKHVSALTN